MTEQRSTYSRRNGPRDRRLRVGVDEREAVAEILRNQHVTGRLDSDEFDERLERCLAARTYAELDELVTDFPRTEAERRQPRQLGWHWQPWPIMFMPLVILAIVASHGRAAWLVVPFFFWFVVKPFAWGDGRRGYRRRFWRDTTG